MPLSHLRRPLFLGLVAHICVLVFLHSRGYFCADPPEELLRFKYSNGIVRGVVASPLKEDGRGPKIFLDARTLQSRPFSQKLLAYLPKGRGRELRPGMPVELEGRLRLPRPARNPGDFDEETFLHDRGASWVLKADSIRVLGPPPKSCLLQAWAEGARRSLEDFFRTALSADEARVFSGLTLGFKGPLRRDWNRAVQDAGVMHLLVPSGAKVAFVMLAVFFLCPWLGLRPWPRFIVALLVGGFYTLMVGAEAPYTRAFCGLSALGFFQLSGRDSGAFQAITWAGWVTLLLEPRELFSAGFQMTYAAAFGLAAAMPQIQKGLSDKPRWLRVLAGTMAASVIVQVMLWPIFADVFGRGSLIGVLANIVLVPASGLLMGAGFGGWALGFYKPAMPFLNQGLGFLARIFIAVCRFFAGLPLAAVDLSPMGPAAVIVYYLLIFALLMASRRRLALGLLTIAIALWAGTAAVHRFQRPTVSVLLLRLPPAYPAVVSFADGRVWLVDPGTKVAAVLKALKNRGVKAVDRLVLLRPLTAAAGSRLRSGISVREILRVQAPWSFCQKEICFEFGGPEGPRVLRGEAQYSIIPGRLRLGAVEVSTDGDRADIR